MKHGMTTTEPKKRNWLLRLCVFQAFMLYVGLFCMALFNPFIAVSPIWGGLLILLMAIHIPVATLWFYAIFKSQWKTIIITWLAFGGLTLLESLVGSVVYSENNIKKVTNPPNCESFSQKSIQENALELLEKPQQEWNDNKIL
ncbi:MAG: hypothetical protein Q4C70_04135 [Planctomycetia bacterium]|nr:hypothetical protein [Planctomycetia bacterium]